MNIPAYHKEAMKKYPKGQWVFATNNGSNDYSVFADLFEWGLVERKIEEVYCGKILVGKRFYFKY